MTRAGRARVLAFPLVGVAAHAHADAAQIGYLWSFDDLTLKADLIVIAEPVTTSEHHRTEHPGLDPGFPVVELVTTFTVLVILKRDPAHSDDRELALLHYRIDWDEWNRRNPPRPGQPPPGLVNSGSTLQFTGEHRAPHLLFLRRRGGGQYEPLSGHTHPTDSAFLLRKQTRAGQGR